MNASKKKKWKILFGVLVVAAAGALFVSFGPPRLLAKTETPLFCSSCHVMQAEYEAWFHVGAHRTIQCVDCHLPHQNVGVYYLWKSIDGMKDMVVFHSGMTPEVIQISAHAQKVLQSNCIRCHESRVERIDQDRNCWSCHRWLQHNQVGIRSTSES